MRIMIIMKKVNCEVFLVRHIQKDPELKVENF